MSIESPTATRLHRSIPLPLLVMYGVGTMVGAGFYALLGRVALHAGMQVPLSFLVAATIALVTALSFSELASRIPVSAGEPRYVDEAFHLNWLSTFIGWSVISTGVVSAATMTRAFTGFAQDLFRFQTQIGILLFVAGLTAVAIRGILQSVWLAAFITIVELAGLGWVLVANVSSLARLPDRWLELVPTSNWDTWSGVLVAAFLAFYAFIGFEDVVNEAEEVRDARRNVPRGILWALLITTALYIIVSLTAVLAFHPDELAASRTPLALLVSHYGDGARTSMTFISLLAGVNGALVQLIMSSRVAFGMADHGLAPQLLASVHDRYKTPTYATLLMGTLILVFALWLPLESLARITSAIMLFNFAVVNASLIKIKLKSQDVDPEIRQYPLFVPILGCVLCSVFLVLQWFVLPA